MEEVLVIESLLALVGRIKNEDESEMGETSLGASLRGICFLVRADAMNAMERSATLLLVVVDDELSG